MTKNKVRRSVAALLCVACVVLLVLGGLNLPKKSNAKGEAILENLRVRMLLNVTGAGVVESYVNIAKQEAQAKAKAEGGGMAAIREAVKQAEEDTRAKYENAEFAAGVVASPELIAATDAYNGAMMRHGELETVAQQAYIDAHYEEAKAKMEAEREALLAEGKEVSEDETVEVDMSGFVATQEMLDAQAVVDSAYVALGQELKKVYDVLDDEALASLRGTVDGLMYQPGDDFDTQYDRYLDQCGGKSTASGYLVRHSDDLLW